MKKTTILSYKGYRTTPKYSADDKIFYGTIMGIPDKVYFQADRAEDLEKEFHESVDDYLAFCAEIGREPQKEPRLSIPTSRRNSRKMVYELLMQKTASPTKQVGKGSVSRYKISGASK